METTTATSQPYPKWIPQGQVELSSIQPDIQTNAQRERPRHDRGILLDRGRTIRTVVRGGIGLVAMGLLFYGCSGDDEDSFGSHSVAEAPSPSAVIENAKLRSDLNFLDLPVTTRTSIVGREYSCAPFGLGCMTTSAYTARISAGGDVNVVAPLGSIELSAETGENGRPIVTVALDTEMLAAEISNPDTNSRGESYGWAAIADVFTSDNERNEFERIAADYGQDHAVNATMDAVEQQGNALDAALVEALRDQINVSAGLLDTTDPDAAAVLRQMGEDDSTFIVDHGGNSIDIRSDSEYTPGEKVTIEGVEFTFGEVEPARLNPEAASKLSELAHDPNVTVINDPALQN